MNSVTVKFSDWMQFQPKQLETVRHIVPPDGDWTKQKKYIFMGGAKGGGKTACAIGVAVLVALKKPGIKIAIARKTVKELEQQVILEFLSKFPDSLYTYYRSTNTAVFHNGSRINFISFQYPEDALKEQGIERQMYILDEAPQMEETIFPLLRSSMRNPRIDGWRPCILFTGNPGGVSDNWFKTRFIEPDYDEWEPDELLEKDLYAFVQANVYDNKYLRDTDYVTQLKGLPAHLRRAYLEGKWGDFSGQFFEEWNEGVHFLKPDEVFDIPDSWIKWRSIDLGRGKHPSVCLFLTQDPVSGSIYVYREIGHIGSIVEFVDAIRLLSPPNETYIQTFADPAMFAKDNSTYDTTQFFTNMHLEPADNSRQIGWRNMKQWMHWIPPTEGSPTILPKLRFFPSCSGCRKTIPSLRYKKSGSVDDLDTKAADDYADALRYALIHLAYGYVYQGKNRYVRGMRDTYAPDYQELDGGRIRNEHKILPSYSSFDSGYDIETEDGYSTSIYSYY